MEKRYWVLLRQYNDDPVVAVKEGETYQTKAAAIKALMEYITPVEAMAAMPESDVDHVEYSADNTRADIHYKSPGRYAGIKRAYWIAECVPIGQEAQFRSCGNCLNLADYIAKRLIACPLPSDLYKSEEEWAENCSGWNSGACSACLLKNSHLLGKEAD